MTDRLTSQLGLCCLATAVMACDSTVGPLPSNATSYQPPAVYARWWAMTEACSGRIGALPFIGWYSVPGSTVQLNGHNVFEYWSSRGNIIVIPQNLADYATGVRHEMLHSLLRVGGHPREQFLGACAGIVDCNAACSVDAGRWVPPTSSAPLPPDSLILKVEPELMAREADGQRWLALRVKATNPRQEEVLVTPLAETFGYAISGVSSFGATLPLYDSSELYFAPGETKQWLFEFRVGTGTSGFTIPPGTYSVRGSYGQRLTDGPPVTIPP